MHAHPGRSPCVLCSLREQHAVGIHTVCMTVCLVTLTHTGFARESFPVLHIHLFKFGLEKCTSVSCGDCPHHGLMLQGARLRTAHSRGVLMHRRDIDALQFHRTLNSARSRNHCLLEMLSITDRWHFTCFSGSMSWLLLTLHLCA